MFMHHLIFGLKDGFKGNQYDYISKLKSQSSMQIREPGFYSHLGYHFITGFFLFLQSKDFSSANATFGIFV